MKRTRQTQRIAALRYMLVVAVLAILPIVLLFVVNINIVAEFIQHKFNTEPYQIFESSINYLSLAVTVLLGIVVYEQAQKINNLEISQYEVFLGVTGLDNDYSMGDVLLMENSHLESGFQLVHSYGNTAKSFLTNLQLDIGPREKVILFPLMFVVKSSTLITALLFQKIALEISAGELTSGRKEFIGDAEPIYELFEDNSKFVFAIGTMIPKNLEIEEVIVTLDITVNDQICREHQKKVIVKLNNINNTFYLCSSESR